MDTAARLADLQTRGFVVLHSFFQADEITQVREACDFRRRTKLRRHVSAVAPSSAIEPLRRKIAELLPKIRKATNICTDTVFSEGVFLATEYAKIDWHTDFESFFLLQDHYHFLNFWLPVLKPHAERSGLSLVPMDRLADAAPAVHRAVLGRGAARIKDGRLHYEADDGLRTIFCPDLGRLAESPDVLPGDMIVARCDVLHRTQDTDTARIALSIRALASELTLDRSVMLRGSPNKHARMLEYAHLFRPLLACFWLTGKQRMSIAEFHETRRRLTRHEPRAVAAYLAAAALLPVLFLSDEVQSRIRAVLTIR
jgi:hypothetical protein